MTRRTLLATSLGAAAAAALNAAPADNTRLPIKKAVGWGMLPPDLSELDKFKLTKDCGFQEMECQTTPDRAKAEELLAASRETGIRIHSVMNMDHWKYPLSSSDHSVVDKSIAGMETSLHNAKLWGADTVLLVPGVVNPETSYEQCYERSRANIFKLIPLAKQLGVVIAVEEVWNKFLVSPVDYARYIDSFGSPQIKAYFDVGNVVLYGYPQQWIRTLGPRIAKLHIKDFYFRKGETKWVNLGEGDIKWNAIYSALADVGYRGSATLEVAGGGADYLKDVSARFERILSGGEQVAAG
ncbi:MAG TPA: sugar phosphate isomerase/epimerase family protein [Bryobacteraceae bacterium]|jgi:hexulose-6-phosphate isomerase